MKKFNKILVVGFGRVAKECTEILKSKFDNIELININTLQNKDLFFNKLKNYLIISANNFYIFKK